MHVPALTNDPFVSQQSAGCGWVSETPVRFKQISQRLRTVPELYSYPSPPMSEPPSPPRYPPSTAPDESVPPRERELRGWQQPYQLPPTSAPQGPPYAPPAAHPHSPPHHTSPGEPARLGTATTPLAPAPFGRYGATTASAQMSTFHTAGQLQGPLIRPGRARRIPSLKKAHVAAACVNCRRAHLSCDVNRPCGRCVTSGKQDTCVDVEHKKRGRPRLRDREPGDGAQEARASQVQSSSVAPAMTDDLRRTGLRLGPTRVGPRAEMTPGPGQQVGGYFRLPMGTASAAQTPSHPPRGLAADAANPVAFLDLSLHILKTSQAFKDCISGGQDPRHRDLASFVQNQYAERLQRLQSELRAERAERDPTHLPPIGASDGERAVSGVEEADVARLTQGFTERSDIWGFVLSGGSTASLPVRVSLARTTSFFVVLVLPRMSTPTSAPWEHAPSHISPQSFAPGHGQVVDPGSSEFSSPQSPFAAVHSTGATLPPTPTTLTFSPTATNRPKPHAPVSRPTREAGRLPLPGSFQTGPLPTPQTGSITVRSPVHDLLNPFEHPPTSSTEPSSAVAATQPTPESIRGRARGTSTPDTLDDARKRRRLNIDEVLH